MMNPSCPAPIAFIIAHLPVGENKKSGGDRGIASVIEITQQGSQVFRCLVNNHEASDWKPVATSTFPLSYAKVIYTIYMRLP